jgi:hypothetical protein
MTDSSGNKRIWLLKWVLAGNNIDKQAKSKWRHRKCYMCPEKILAALKDEIASIRRCDSEITWWESIGYPFKTIDLDDIYRMNGYGDLLLVLKQPHLHLYIECLTLDCDED